MATTDEAVRLARLTNISTDDWLNRVRQGKYTATQLKATAHYRAHVALMEAAKPPAPVPVPPPSSVDLEPVRNLLVFATVTDDIIQLACRLPARWKFLFTADPAYRVTDQQINAVRASGHRAFAWGDCRTTLPAQIKAFQQARRLDDWYGQAESAGEFDAARSGGANKVIGNLSAIRPDQLVLVAAAQMLFALELYLNVHPWEQPDYHGAQDGVGGNCGAVYASEAEHAVYTPVSGQRKEWFHPHGSWYVEGFRPADWETVRSWG